MRVITVFAGDPTSGGPPGAWDRRAGFGSAAEAALARREEDRRACIHLGIRSEWLPFPDDQYEGSPSDEEVWEAVVSVARGATTVLGPGFPLIHPQHERLAHLTVKRTIPGARTGLYVEQPVTMLRHLDLPASVPALLPTPVAWSRLPATPRDRWSKLKAFRSYGSQLRLIDPRPLLAWRLTAHDLWTGGEIVTWVR